MKLAEYIADFLAEHGISDVFTVTGGGAMHLNDAFGHSKKLHCTYNHHEQASAIAAEAYTRLTGRLAAVCVTSGPGGTNALTGVLGGWLDSIPMFIISGQVKRETTTWSTDVQLRQLGDQEFQIVDAAKTMTKYAVMITEPDEIRYHLEKALFLSKAGRGGPVWLDIPLDVQAAQINPDELRRFDPDSEEIAERPVYNTKYTDMILEAIRKSEKPVVLAGTAIRLAGAYDDFISCIRKLKVPVVTAWNADDLLTDDDSLYCGRPGTVGTRGGNFVIQNCDLLLVLGCRMNIRMISYNRYDFAKNAYKIVVDIDDNELRKPTVKIDMPVHADVGEVMRAIADTPDSSGKFSYHDKWLAWCRNVNKKYPAARPECFSVSKPMNPYAFLDRFFRFLPEGEDIICGNGSACVMTFQAAVIKKNQRLFTNSGCAAMGYGFPASIGACIARNNKRIFCIDGDGSFQMNIQELQTVIYNRLNIKIIYLNNNGYHSIRQTQTNLFSPPLVGVCNGNGLSFPDAEKIAAAYGLMYVRIDSLEDVEEKLRIVISADGPVFCEAVVDPSQNFEPKLASKVLPDGTIVSPELDDMYPFIRAERY